MKNTLCHVAGSVLTVLVAAAPLASWAAARAGASNGTFAIFTADSSGAPPAAKTIVGAISDHVCRRPWDLAASDAEALAPLEARARTLGATGTAVVFGGDTGH